MTAEAIISKDADTIDVTTPAGGYAAGEVIELADGRASVVAGLAAKAAGDPAALKTKGKYSLQKSTAVVCLKGGEAYWDRSAGVVTSIQDDAGGDFPCGVFVADATLASTEVVVDLNVKPVYLIDLHRDAFAHALVKTVVGSTTVLMPILENYGGAARMAFGLTAEAQKLDLLSLKSVPVSIPFIAEFRIAIYDISDNAAADFNVGIANATHATDCDAITESCFIHLDGTALDIKAESDDGTTEVAATDTTIDAVDDTYFQVWMDCRDLTAIKIYVNGVRVLSATAFKLNLATGPLKLLAHMEKTADDGPGDLRVSHMAIRVMDLAS